jgi:hypothetical protein
MEEREPTQAEIEDTLRTVSPLLRDADVPFMLGGSLAAWVRGGPLTRNDLDIILKPEDAERACEVLAEAGLRTERPPEDWLFKAWHGEVLIDLIFHPKGLQIDDAAFDRGEVLDVFAIPTRVMSLEDMVCTKLHVLEEHTLDLEPLLQIARSLRERIDWEQVRARTADSPFAKAFFTLVEELGIVARHEAPPAARRSRVRVVGSPEPPEPDEPV